jgi:hypothetical protein
MKDSIIKTLTTRSRKSDQQRLLAILLLIIICLFCEFTIGNKLEESAVAKIATNDNTNWAEKRYTCEQNQLPIQPKKTRYRILYLSNSHAFTGGYAPQHLQIILDLIFPGEYEIVNMSSPGMFAPEFLERFATTTNYNIDTLILPIAYISFADRMKLTNQALSAHSFFKPDIFQNLPLTFWWRNYDLGLFTNKSVEHLFRLYKYRNSSRNIWEKPLAHFLHQQIGWHSQFPFLEVDENQTWRFPDGFDRNLFDWSLYALGRKKHLMEISDLITQANKRNIPILASNLPIDFAKDPHVVNQNDFENYRKNVAKLFESTTNYVDHQNTFPKEFSTYDALHPTWHGARLHALNFALQLNALRKEKVSNNEIFSVFNKSDSAVSNEYKELLNGQYTELNNMSIRRYDLFEPKNAKDLLVRLSLTKPGSYQATEILYQLSLRLRYWQQSDFKNNFKSHTSKDTWEGTVSIEIDKARQRAKFFQDELVNLQNTRLVQFPIPNMSKRQLISSVRINIQTSGTIIKEQYRLEENILVTTYVNNKTKKNIAFTILNNRDKVSYTRIDLLGNNSYIQLSYASEFKLPQWIYTNDPIRCFGL